MKRTNKYVFDEEWWRTMSGLSEQAIGALCVAINRYAFDGVMVELDPMLAGMFARIKMDIDERKARRDDVSAKRSIAGRSGAEKTNAERWGCRQMSAIADFADKSSAIADKMSAIADKNQQLPIIPPIPPFIVNNNINTSTTTAGARTYEETAEMVFGWITDNAIALSSLLQSKKAIAGETPPDQMARIIRPCADEFIRGEISSGTDFERKGRTDTKRHFKNWLLKQQTRIENGQLVINDNGTNQQTNMRVSRTDERAIEHARAVASAIVSM